MFDDFPMARDVDKRTNSDFRKSATPVASKEFAQAFLLQPPYFDGRVNIGAVVGGDGQAWIVCEIFPKFSSLKQPLRDQWKRLNSAEDGTEFAHAS
jgi:hypothetical protein